MISSTVSRHYHEWPISPLYCLSRRTYWLFCFLSHLLFLYKLMKREFNYFYYLYIHFNYVFMVKCSHLYMLYLWILRVTVLHQNNFICYIELSFYYIIRFFCYYLRILFIYIMCLIITNSPISTSNHHKIPHSNSVPLNFMYCYFIL